MQLGSDKPTTEFFRGRKNEQAKYRSHFPVAYCESENFFPNIKQTKETKLILKGFIQVFYMPPKESPNQGIAQF